VTDATHGPINPSPWVLRFAGLVAAGGTVLDVAAGGGRHARLFLARGHAVVAVDRDVTRLESAPGLGIVRADLESGPWPFEGRVFAGIIVTHYLHRPLMPRLLAALAPGGALIYETYAKGNERFGRPRDPDFLLRRGELLEVARAGELTVIAYEDVTVAEPRPSTIQRIAAVREPYEGL
jgi:SAM-dependent methyltransferase